MIKSIVVAYLIFPIDGMMSCIKGKGNGFRFIFLFNPQNSEMNRIVLFFLGIAKGGHAHSEDFIGDKLLVRLTSSLLFSLFFLMSVGYEKVWHRKIFLRPLVRKKRVNRSTCLFSLGRLGYLHELLIRVGPFPVRWGAVVRWLCFLCLAWYN